MGRDIRVLHVDDEPDFLEAASSHLERVDDRFEVVTETDPDAALERVENGAVDCVVSDYEMGETNGLELLAAVREHDADLPFVLFTGKGSETVASEAIAAGVTDYLKKQTGSDQYELLANRVANAVDRYRSRRAVAQTRERFRRLHEHTGDFVLVIGTDGAIQHATAAIEDVLGLDPESVVGTRPREYTHPDDVDELLETFETVLENPDQEVTVEFRMEDGEGDWQWMEGRGRNLLDDPLVEGVVANVRTISERKRRKQDLQRQNERLEEFAEIVSHDLQSPLNVAKGRIGLAQGDCDSPHLDEAETAVRRMEEIIENTLELAASGRTVNETGPVELAAVARDSWETVETAGGALRVETDRVIDADPDRLRNVFENLFRNSMMHGAAVVPSEVTTEDDPIITITVGPLDDGFFVADDGAGIPPAERDDVFESDYSTSDDGTGFGLAIVDRIAQAHGWTVHVTDSEEGGARFEFTGVDFENS